MNVAKGTDHHPDQCTTHLQQLDEVMVKINHLLILPHNNPDPDAIASAMALKYLAEQRHGIATTIRYEGIVGRAENRALVSYLRNPMKRLVTADLTNASHIALIDTQPGAGNHPLPAHWNPTIVIDHHELRGASQNVCFTDIRPEIGAASSIMVEYLRLANLDIPLRLATALFYGVKSDTQSFERHSTPCDHEAHCHLLNLVDLEALYKIERAQLPTEYFQTLARALQTASHHNDVVVAYLEKIPYPDVAAAIADLLMRHQGTKWVICAGIHKKTLYISVRTQLKRGAGQLVRKVIGPLGCAGGHGSLAGGQVILKNEDPKQLMANLTKEFLMQLNGTDADAQPFI